MTVSPPARALIEAALALIENDGPRFVASLRARDWKQAALDVALAELRLAAAAGAPGAALALSVAPLAMALSLHPADPASPAMQKASGGAGVDNISTGA